MIIFIGLIILGTFFINFAGTGMTGFMNSTSSVLTTSYLSKPNVLNEINQNFSAMESELQNEVDHVKENYPGYDEYNYSLSEISHNPFELAALLTVLYENYTPNQVAGMLQTVFDKQYKLTLKERVIEGDEDEDDYYILNVKLTNHGIAAAISTLNLTEEQIQPYLDAYRKLKGITVLFENHHLVFVNKPASIF